MMTEHETLLKQFRFCDALHKHLTSLCVSSPLAWFHCLMHPPSGHNWWHIIGYLQNCLLDGFLIDKKQLRSCFCLLHNSKQLCGIRNVYPFADQSVSPPLSPTPSGAPFLPHLSSESSSEQLSTKHEQKIPSQFILCARTIIIKMDSGHLCVCVLCN